MQSYGYQPAAPVVLVPNVSGRPMPVFIAPQQPQIAPPVHSQPLPTPQPINPEDLKLVYLLFHLTISKYKSYLVYQVQEMFPNIDPEVIKSVYEANHGNKDTTINSLLQMTND